MIRDLILKNRSYRRFFQDEAISIDLIRELIDLARFSPSGGNIQPLKYIIANEPEKNSSVFRELKWAGYLKDWDGPEEGEKPSAYIIVLGDKEISKNFGCDHGIACQSILLGASEKGLGGCIFGSINRTGLRKSFDIDERYEILLVIALGKPKEKVVLDETVEETGIRYWRDDEKAHHVPKRKLDDIIL